jgi:ABC-type Fe3+ transport system substrate-binding protein
MGATMMIRFRTSVVAAAVLIAAASSSLTALASEGLAPAQPVVSKRVTAAPAPAARLARSASWYKAARVAWNGGHNPNVILGVAY